MRQIDRGEYPQNWKEIAQQIKEQAGWRCVRCQHEHDPKAGEVDDAPDDALQQVSSGERAGRPCDDADDEREREAEYLPCRLEVHLTVTILGK